MRRRRTSDGVPGAKPGVVGGPPRLHVRQVHARRLPRGEAVRHRRQVRRHQGRQGQRLGAWERGGRARPRVPQQLRSIPAKAALDFMCYK